MFNSTLTQTVTLVPVTCWCGMPHAIPKDLDAYNQRQRDNGLPQQSVYCPAGHSWSYSGKSKVELLERDLAAERARKDQLRQEVKVLGDRLNAEKAAKSRLKNRVAAGVCPCCNRTFQNLARHMKGQHPDFAAKD